MASILLPGDSRNYLNKPPPLLNRRGAPGSVVFFVHGIYSSSASTWTDLIALIREDDDLSQLAFDVYEYPSRFFGIPIFQRILNIEQLASGLRTQINAHFGKDRKIKLVGHSLGGVIARRFLVEELKAGRSIDRYSIMCLASPHAGATLASLGRRFSLHRKQVEQLVPGSPELRTLAAEWSAHKVETLIDVQYVGGGADAVVQIESSLPLLNADNSHVIAGCDHASIARPQSKDDLSYVVIKNFLLPQTSNISVPQLPQRKADPLFEIYDVDQEQYYYEREDHEHFLKHINAEMPVWVFGPSGAGKTSVLRRLAQMAGWDLKYVSLSGYKVPTEEKLYREVLIQILDLEGDLGNLDALDNGELARRYRSKIASNKTDRQRFVLIEEIPTSDSGAYVDFIGLVTNLATVLQSESSTRDRVLFAISSISDPLNSTLGNSQRIKTKIQLIEFEKWTDSELQALLDLVLDAVDVSLSAEESATLIQAADGLPRFLKLVLRDYRNKPTGEPLLSRISRIRVENLPR